MDWGENNVYGRSLCLIPRWGYCDFFDLVRIFLPLEHLLDNAVRWEVERGLG